MTYTVSQIFVIISYLFLALSYLKTKRKEILIIGICSLIAQEIAYFLLSAYTGVAMVAIAMIRNIYFYYDEKKNGIRDKINTKDIIVLIILLAIIFVSTILTYDGIPSLFSVIETLLYTISVWQKSPEVYKYLGVPTSLSCIFYHIYIKSIFGMILETIVFISEIIGIVKDKKNKKKID